MENIIQSKVFNASAWYKQWFDSDFYHRLYSNRSEKEAKEFVTALVGELAPAANCVMLDLGCGAGRHSKWLAANGFNVTGVDLAASSIRVAKRSERPNLHFARHDMRDAFGIGCFDYIFNFFTSFGYFSNDKDHHKVIRNIYHALKPGGTLVLDYLNVRWCEDRLVRDEVKEIDGIIYHISRWADHKFFYKRIEVANVHADRFEFIEQVAKFNLDDFEKMFEKNGLKIEKVYGDYGLNEYDNAYSPRMILLAKKKVFR